MRSWKLNKIFLKKLLTNEGSFGIINIVAEMSKRRRLGPVAQLVRAPACHAGGRGFKSHPGRQKKDFCICRSLFLQLKEMGRGIQKNGTRFYPDPIF